MTITAGPETPVVPVSRFEPETPFAETYAAEEPQVASRVDGFVPWIESFSPFAEAGSGGVVTSGEREDLADEILEGIHDEAFEEALAELVGETAELVDQRLVGESATALISERERLGEGHLAPVAFEAEQYVERLKAGLAGMDLASLSEDQLGEVLDRFDASASGVSPAGEEFLGSIGRIAKGVVRTAAKVATTVGAKLLAPIADAALGRLKSLIKPLLRRVLAMAINRLPAALQEPARQLGKRYGLEAEAEEAYRSAGPVAVGDPEMLARSFDAALAEALIAGESLTEQGQSFGYEYEDEEPAAESHLETLAEARADLVEKLGAANDGENMAPAIEQFVPALLPALRVAIRIVGRPKVISFMAGYVAKLISQWVGPSLARPLSSAIVDTGLRLVSLEQPEPGELDGEAGPILLAATIEDTVRRLAEQEDYVFEDEDLLQLAVSDAFEQSVAGNFPAQFVRPDLQVAPTLAGSFLPRFHRQVFAYKKFSAAPEVDVTAAIAQSVRTFGGVTLAAALRASGRSLPLRARVHVYESTVGTSLPRLARLERVPGLGSHRATAFNQLHPLTPEAAAVLLREPRLGVRKPPFFLRSRQRIAVGQRFYYLEPVRGVQTAAGGAAPRRGRSAMSAPTTTPASAATITVDLRRSEVAVSMYFSEADAQATSAAMAKAPAGPGLLKALADAYDGAARSLGQAGGPLRIVKEYEAGEDQLGAPEQRLAPAVLEPFRLRLDAWVRTMLAQWVRARGQEFSRAAQSPAAGVTVTLRLRGVPGLNVLRQAMSGRLGADGLRAVRTGDSFRGTPSGAVSVTPGRSLR